MSAKKKLSKKEQRPNVIGASARPVYDKSNFVKSIKEKIPDSLLLKSLKKDFKEEEVMLREKKINDKLYIILEGYVEDETRVARGADQIPGYRRIYRALIHPKGVSGKEWSSHQRTVSPPARYQPTHVLLKVYAYWPEGTVYFNNVFLREKE